MYTNYLDTVTMYYVCPFDIRNLFKIHWILDNRNSDCNLHNLCIKTPYSFVRFFPNMYRSKRLYVTFSLPKLYYQCNRNTDNVADYDNATFMNILYQELNSVMDMSQLPIYLKDWQPSRIDLFLMKNINPINRLEYHYGYGRLMYRGTKTTTYKNTNYLPSSHHGKQSCILLRTYNKTIEEQDKKSLLYGNLPTPLEKEHENIMLNMDIPNNKYRFEFSLRRSAIKKYIKRYGMPLNMESIMEDKFQKLTLNDLVITRGLHHNILCKNDYKKIVHKIFHHKKTIDNALKMAECIRNKKSIPLKPHQQYRIQHILNSYYISTATTNFVSIKGLDLLH